jgi:hypothetical protein
MRIELLKFQISPPERTQEFIEADSAVWNPWLQQQRGYLRKAYATYPNGIVHIRIYWASPRDLAAASKSPEIPAIDVRLKAAFLGVYARLP